MTKEEIMEARKICDKATPAPWYFTVKQKNRVFGALIAATAPGHQIRDDEKRTGGTYPSNDGGFIAAARTGWPKALDEIERLREALGEIGYCDTRKQCGEIATKALER